MLGLVAKVCGNNEFICVWFCFFRRFLIGLGGRVGGLIRSGRTGVKD